MKPTKSPHRRRLLTKIFLSVFLLVPILVGSFPGFPGSEKGVLIPQQVAAISASVPVHCWMPWEKTN